MLISRLLTPNQIKLNLEERGQSEAIREVAVLLKGHPSVVEFEAFYQELLAREKVETTCVNEIAFPHARTDHLKAMVLSVGRSEKGVWFENSGQNVRLVFVIGTPKRMVTEYLSVVGGLARLIKDDNVKGQLLRATTSEEFLEVISRTETR